MSTISKQWLQHKISDMEEHRNFFPGDLDDDHGSVLAALRIALASLEAEAVGEVVLGEYDDCGCHPDARVACIAADGQADWENFKDGTRLFTAPPASAVNAEPVSFDALRDAVAEVSGAPAMEWSDIYKGHQAVPFINFNSLARIVDKFCSAMLQGAEPVTMAYKLPELRYLDTVKFNADCALQDPESIYAQEFFMSLDEVFGERGNYTEPVQAKAVSILIAEIFRLRGYPAAPQQEAKNV